MFERGRRVVLAGPEFREVEMRHNLVFRHRARPHLLQCSRHAGGGDGDGGQRADRHRSRSSGGDLTDATVQITSGSRTATRCGAGGDMFVLPPASQGFDTITGFTEPNGDLLDLRAALASTGWNGKSATLGNYLKVTDSGGNTNIAIAAGGVGAGTPIASLSNTNYLLADLVSHHLLLTW